MVDYAFNDGSFVISKSIVESSDSTSICSMLYTGTSLDIVSIRKESLMRIESCPAAEVRGRKSSRATRPKAMKV